MTCINVLRLSCPACRSNFLADDLDPDGQEETCLRCGGLLVSAGVFDLATTPRPQPRPQHVLSTEDSDARKRAYLDTAITNAERLLDRSTAGTRHAARLKAGRLLGGYVPEFLSLEDALDALEPAMLRATAKPAYAKRDLLSALQFGMRQPVTFEQLERERLTWKGQRYAS